MVDSLVLRDPHLWIRFTEMVFAIVAFSTVNADSGYSRVNFCIFCGVTTFVFAFFFILFYAADVPWARGTGALVIDSIWWVFWLSNAAALSALVNNFHGQGGLSKSQLNASVAFSWMTWFLYWGDIYYDLDDMDGGGRTIIMPPLSAFTVKSSGGGGGGGVQMAGGLPPAGTITVTT